MIYRMCYRLCTSKRQAVIYRIGQTIVAAEFSTLFAQFHQYIAQVFASLYGKSSPDGSINPGELSVDNLSISFFSQATVYKLFVALRWQALAFGLTICFAGRRRLHARQLVLLGV